ncbi:hypothetical protein [uncultured Bacteroides sp.]|uniref:hypothetical protein n=1 Tax=uncultured Bacteroides sp. TaxID=162156 RepID=UPI0026221F16|nr:hypothetical protein [uncultured Bacteroides sp.]
MNNKILNISTIILTIVLSSLSLIPDNRDNNVFQWIRENSLIIALSSGSLVILLHLFELFFSRDKYQKEWLKTFLKHIVDEHLGSDTYQTRISILRKQPGYIVFFKTFWFYGFVCFINNFKAHCWKQSFRNIAIHLMSDYLVIYVRYSYPKAKKSCTYFRLSDKSEKKKFNGIADKCYQHGIDLNVTTDNINDIDLPSNINDLSAKQKKRVEKYMKDCHFDKEFYNSIKVMHKIANNLYAVPVALSDQSIWGVVIIDNESNDFFDFKTYLKDYMPSYMKIINFSLSSLKH